MRPLLRYLICTFSCLRVVEELIKRQADTTITIHKTSNFCGDSVNTIEADLTDFKSCKSAIKDKDYVIHCNAVSGGLGRHQKDLLSAHKPNLRMKVNILEAIEEYPSEVFHFTSNNSVINQ